MQMRVREQGDEVHIELIGVAGRQHSVLRALNDCQRTRDPAGGAAGFAPSDIRLRVGTNDMRIELKGRNGQRFEAAAIYQCLRRALIEQPRAPTAGTAAT